jgi:hypothetical protein
MRGLLKRFWGESFIREQEEIDRAIGGANIV